MDANAIGAVFALPDASAGQTVRLSDGRILTTWLNVAQSPFAVEAQLFSSNGSPLGPAFIVSTETSYAATPTATALAGGGFAITYEGATNSSIYDSARVQVFDAAGAKIGGEITVSGHGYIIAEAITGLANGGFVASWYDVTADSNGGLLAQLFDARGNKLGGVFAVNSTAPGEQDNVHLLSLPSGGFVAVWTDSGSDYGKATGHQGIWAQIFNADGSKVGGQIAIAASGSSIELALLNGGDIGVWWQDAAGQHRQLLDSSGQRIGNATVVTSTQLGEIAFISGVDANDQIAPTSFDSWTGTNGPAYYSAGTVSVGKWGAPTAGTAATISYSFADDAHWTATEQAAIIATLDLWSAEAGVTFTRVAGGGEIAFDRGTDGNAETDTTVDGTSTIGSTSLDTLTHADISIDTSVEGFGPIGGAFSVEGSYPWMTLLHEEGHAIGLGHSGAYNGDDGGFEGVSAFSAYDSRAYSLMSYFDATDTGTVATPPGGFAWGDDGHGDDGSELSSTTPMLLDILAAERLYGAPAATPLSGGQIFGFNTNIGGDIRQFFDFTVNTMPVETLFDIGAGNTLDLSGFAASSIVDLHQGAFSSVAGLTNNIAIAFGTRIDTVIGGAGSDRLVANDDGDTLVGGAGNDLLTAGSGDDTLTGGLGADTFMGTPDALNGDIVTDFAAGDRIAFLGVAEASLAYSLQGDTLRFGADSLTLEGFTGMLQLVADAQGNAELIVRHPFRPAGLADFTGDGHSDILFQNVNGAVSTWTVVGSGADVRQSVFNAGVDRSWQAIETLDVNGDGLSDILYHNDAGALAVWTSTGTGFNQSAYLHAPVGSDWRVAAVGDMNGDGKDDILWQNANGSLSSWTSTGVGFAENSYAHVSPGAGWQVEGLGDFDGDGTADILWRNTSGGVAMWANIGQGVGFNEGSFYQPAIPTSWHVDGIGDFNGDGRDDILWRNDDGAVSIWQSAGTGFTQNVYNSSVPTSWHIAAVGDFNDDGKGDILWRNDDGAVSTWQSNGQGFDMSVANGSAAISWHIVAHTFLL